MKKLMNAHVAEYQKQFLLSKDFHSLVLNSIGLKIILNQWVGK